MEHMLRNSEFLTILIQAFFITLSGVIFIGCGDELLDDIKKGCKILKKKKGDRKNLREYTCPICGYSAWALDHIKATTCRHCGASVITKPIPKIEKSVFNLKGHKGNFEFIEK